MFTTPEAFMDMYKAGHKPLFYIHKGDSPTGKIMRRFTEIYDVESSDECAERTADGIRILDEFFQRYPWGEVTIETFTSPRADKKSRDFYGVSWGEQPAKYGRSSMGSTGGGGGGGGMKDFIAMFGFLQQLQNQNNATLMSMIKESHEKDIKIMGLEQEAQGEGMTTRDFLLTELIQCIKPVATAWAAKQTTGAAAMPSMPPPQPAIGSTGAAEAPAGPKADTSVQNPHPMQGASIDYIMKCVRAVAENVFPEYNVNESMMAMAQMSVQYRDTIRQFVLPIIQQNRQKVASAKAAPPAVTKDEEE